MSQRLGMPTFSRIRIVVADDHFVARLGLRGLLSDQPDFDVVGEAKTGAEAVTICRTLQPDVVMMDLRMPGMDGIGATAALARELPSVRVLIISSYDTEADVLRVHEAGAAGYIMKEAEPEEILRAVRAVAKGERYLPPQIQARLNASAEHGKLTARDVRMLEFIGEGLSNKEIAARMELTAGTVRIYVSHILSRLSVSNRAEAATAALARGLIRTPEKR